jgi:hypothetical protein
MYELSISQKTIFFIVTAVNTSNLTRVEVFPLTGRREQTQFLNRCLS